MCRAKPPIYEAYMQKGDRYYVSVSPLTVADIEKRRSKLRPA
jgi:hypothetical protein